MASSHTRRSRRVVCGWAIFAAAAAFAATVDLLGRPAAAQAATTPRAATAPATAASQNVRVRRGTPAIFLMDPDGSNPRPLVKIRGAQSHGTPSWSPDGNWVAFDATASSFVRAEVFAYAVVGPQKGTLKNLGPGNCPTFSRDASQIAFYLEARNAAGGQPGVYLMNADGSGRRFLCGGDHPKWSPDGKRLMVTHEVVAPATVDEVDVATGRVTNLLATQYAKIPGAVYSPDGNRVAFVGYHDLELEQSDLVVCDLAAAAAAREAGKPQSAAMRVRYNGRCGWVPNWSPDGKQLTFARWETRGGTGCEVANVIGVDGKDPPVKLKGADEACSRTNEGEWSPDGKTLVIASDRPFPAAQLTDRPDPPAGGR